MSLQVYTRKRNFANTPEPSGKAKNKSKALTFVVQRHDASRLHYDFRLQVNGVHDRILVPQVFHTSPPDKKRCPGRRRPH